jgi:ketosteroid isomerase-like protein
MPTLGGAAMGLHEALRTASQGYDAYTKGDVEAMVATWGPDITFHVPGRSVLAGTFRGRDEVLAFLGRLADRSGGTFQLEVHDILASEGHVVVLCREFAQRNGRTIDMPAAHVCHADEDGRFREVWFLVEDQGRLDEFWS